MENWTWPASTRDVSQEFSELHSGADIAAPQGSPVVSPIGGRVEFAGWNNEGYGNLVIIRTLAGVRVLLAHLQNVLVKPETEVQPGQGIGTVGTTGNSTGPHLHFEVRTPPGHIQQATNPLRFFEDQSVSDDDPTLMDIVTAGAAGALGTTGTAVANSALRGAAKPGEDDDELKLFTVPFLGDVKLSNDIKSKLLNLTAFNFGLLLVFASLVALAVMEAVKFRNSAIAELGKLGPVAGAVDPRAGAAIGAISATSGKGKAAAAGKLIREVKKARKTREAKEAGAAEAGEKTDG